MSRPIRRPWREVFLEARAGLARATTDAAFSSSVMFSRPMTATGEAGDRQDIADRLLVMLLIQFESALFPRGAAEHLHGDQADVHVPGAAPDLVLEVVGVPHDEVDRVHQDVDLAAVERLVEPRRVEMTAGADEPDDALPLRLPQRGHGAVVAEDQLAVAPELLVAEVVQVDQVDPVGPHPLEALAEELPGPLVGRLLGLGDEEDLVADLGDRRAHLLLGEAGLGVAVGRRRVQVVDAQLQRAMQRGADVVRRDLLPLEVRAADPQPRDPRAGAAERDVGDLLRRPAGRRPRRPRPMRPRPGRRSGPSYP